MAELQYARIPELEKQLAAASSNTDDKKEKQLLRNKVTDEEVAEVVSKWTHIPVSKNDGKRKRKIIGDGSDAAVTHCRSKPGSERCV